MLKRTAFTRRLKAATRQAGFTIDDDKPKNKLYVILHGQSIHCNLDMLYDAYQNAPDRLDDIVQTHLAVLKRMPPPPPPPTEKEAAESLLPMLQQRKWLLHTNKISPIPLVNRPFTADLLVSYAFDQPQYRAYFNAEMMDKFIRDTAASLDDIHEYALENLRLRTTSKTYQMQGTGDQTMAVCATNDDFAATRVLLPDLMRTWHGRIPGKMLLGVPNRDFLIAFSDRNPAKTAVIRQIRRDYKRQPYPLSPALLVWENGRIKEYAPKQ